MTKPWSRSRWVALALGFAALLAGYYLFARPWFLRWGATAVETRASLPGDRIIAQARASDTVTRAITIRAPVAEVWPWLAQLGQDRGGFYSYELLEDLVGCEMENADRVHPELGAWKPGDKLWMYPPDKLGGMGHALLVDHVPGRALGFATRRVGTPSRAPYDGSWSFVLEPIDTGTTRFLARGRADQDRGVLGTAFDRFVFDPMHFVMEKKMMETIRRRAEGRPVSEASNVAEVALFTLTFVLFLAAAVLTLRRERWIRAFIGFLGAGIVFQILTFTQPSLLLGAALVLALVAVIALPPRSGALGGMPEPEPWPG
jgi:hypothetical protein